MGIFEKADPERIKELVEEMIRLEERLSSASATADELQQAGDELQRIVRDRRKIFEHTTVEDLRKAILILETRVVETDPDHDARVAFQVYAWFAGIGFAYAQHSLRWAAHASSVVAPDRPDKMN